MGIHGEPGVRRGPLEPAEKVAEHLVARIVEDLPYGSGDEVAVLVNGLGATPREELSCCSAPCTPFCPPKA